MNPYIHTTLILSFSFYSDVHWQTLKAQDAFSVVFNTVLILIYIHFMFKTLFKVLDQSIKKELNTHRQVSTIFNSLQEGIVIV